MKIESNLTPRNHARALRLQANEFVFRRLIKKTSVVRVNADGGINVVVLFSQRNCAFEGVAVRIAGADIQNRDYAGSASSLNHLIAIRVKLRPVDVRVRVNKH